MNPGTGQPTFEHVLYLIFNEGYSSSAGPQLHRPDLSCDAIRMARMLCQLLPDDAEVAGLLTLRAAWLAAGRSGNGIAGRE